MIHPPPDFKKLLSDPAQIMNLVRNEALQPLVKKANKEYLHWDKFRYQPMPAGIDPKLAWAFIKIIRMGSREVLPIRNENGIPFSVNITKWQQKTLSYIDSRAGGIVSSEDGLISLDKKQLVINGLIEEAISSSQIEGASTTRKIAKEMIQQKRSPKNRDEQMIFNNYRAMTKLEEWKKRPLSDDFLLELHTLLTENTLDESIHEGRFREDSDEIVVLDKLTGLTIHTPPKSKEAKAQLKQLYAFANADGEDDYVHPFVKASILHFCLGYIHPFVDGNGRSARALFYWYLLQKGYWMFTFFPISLQIKKKEWRPRYDRVFEYVESDDGDITYFLDYKLKVVESAIDDFTKYLQKKQKTVADLKKRLQEDELNDRQLEIVQHMQRHPNMVLDFQNYMERTGVVYQTARTDLLGLVAKKILKQVKVGKKFVFVKGADFPRTA